MTFNIFIFSWIALGLIAGIYLLRREAPYGRYNNTNWGTMISNKMGWIVMEVTVMLAFASRIPFYHFNFHTPSTVMMILFFIHYIHRSLVYPFMTRTGGKKMPIVIMVSAMVFNTVNGCLLGNWFAHHEYDNSWYHSPFFITGSLLFVTGMLINWTSDYYLISLRKKGDTGYYQPRGGLFNLVSSPNLLGEIIEWGGYALLTWSLPGLAFFIWTCANLVPRALANRRWYRSKFPEYPRSIKRLLPFIW